MENKEALLKNTRQKIEEIDRKIERMKDWEVNSNLKQEAINLLHHLGNTRDRLKQQYDSISEEIEDKKVTEVQKNIFNSIQSFDNTYSKAGHIFKTYLFLCLPYKCVQ